MSRFIFLLQFSYILQNIGLSFRESYPVSEVR